MTQIIPHLYKLQRNLMLNISAKKHKRNGYTALAGMRLWVLDTSFARKKKSGMRIKGKIYIFEYLETYSSDLVEHLWKAIYHQSSWQPYGNLEIVACRENPI